MVSEKFLNKVYEELWFVARVMLVANILASSLLGFLVTFKSCGLLLAGVFYVLFYRILLKGKKGVKCNE